MLTPEDAKRSATFTFNAAADAFDSSALGFRDYFGRKTVEKLSIGEGARVLDVCCGTGSSAIPAAELVGPSGFVIGIDLADRLLALAREKARRRGLKNVDFRAADMLELDYLAKSFDVVLCVFGIFFVPDMPAAVRQLWRLVRPGGKLAITTWGRNVLEPANSLFWRSVRELRSELPVPSNPWDRIADPEGLRQMLRDGGVQAVEVIAEHKWHPIRSPEDWWTIVLGSGRRKGIQRLTPEEVTAVKEANLAFIRDRRNHAIGDERSACHSNQEIELIQTNSGALGGRGFKRLGVKKLNRVLETPRQVLFEKCF
jgi:ubiquinone/menaquinone biosynthesis C-methylase UbiE